jgi:phosphatidylserine/phosphatidylglycerophosphate/cardiolipin synthase-like enzyme
MRIRVRTGPLSVRAIAGTNVVLLAMDLPKAMANQLLGFAVERVDETEGITTPLLGTKTFAETEPPGHVPGTPLSTFDHPIQAFLWGDYTARPDHDYTYRVAALGGTPSALVPLAETVVPVATETSGLGVHGVWFNRGVAASQAYVRRFANRRPSQVADREAYVWLSRGLEEAFLDFVGRAGPGDALRAAVYEFQYSPALEAFRAARDRGADVRIVVDCKPNSDDAPRAKNLAAIAAAGIGDLVVERTSNKSYIAHNKFVVLVRAGQPISVWTGSTNLTEGGVFGHSNVGHVVRQPAVAARFLDYWMQLADDPERPALSTWTELAALPTTPKPPPGTTVVFSPRKSLAALQWYADLMDRAKRSVFFTAAFGISAPLEAVLAVDRPYLRYGLLERADESVELLKRDRDNVFAVGAKIEDDLLDGWAKEALTGFNVHVRYIHTKFMLVDPLSSDPIVITGSANFSDASTRQNDENMLVIRGSTRVADLYLGEFMRLFNHFEFRSRVAADRANGRGPELAGGLTSAAAGGAAVTPTGEATTAAFRHLVPTPTWAWEHYVPGWRRTRERELFR